MNHSPPKNYVASSTKFVSAGDLLVRDLNGNGVLDTYEDPRAPIEDRVEDLMSQMSLDEKVGLMFHCQVGVPGKPKLDTLISMSSAPVSKLLTDRKLNHFNILFAPDTAKIAGWQNRLQRLAETTRLGIPVTLSSDPRHAADNNPGAGLKQEGFSEWPSQLGLAAIGSEETIEQFGAVAQREFKSVGIRTILNPMADVATEPRWGRVGGTFGEDFKQVGRYSAAYIRGFQITRDLSSQSVSCMVKHFPGGGPQEDGTEPHFAHGANQVYPANRFDDHLAPFRDAFSAGARQVMLSYGIPVNQTENDVAVAFNADVVQKLLRQELAFDGVVCTDWCTHEKARIAGVFSLKPASDWGVEHLSLEEKYQRSVEIGVDQFGGQSDPKTLLDLVRNGTISEARIDQSARRILRLKFELGLFDNPYVDENEVINLAHNAAHREAGLQAQHESTILLTNKTHNDKPILPLSGQPKIYSQGLSIDTVREFGEPVRELNQADIAILSLKTPKDFHLNKHILAYFFAEGRLDFKPRKLRKILKICRTVPTIVNIRLDRPAVIPEIADQAMAVLATFGVNDSVLLDAIFGKFSPSGKLPVEMPASMEAVIQSQTDSPGTNNPLFPRGHGLSYNKTDT